MKKNLLFLVAAMMMAMVGCEPDDPVTPDNTNTDTKCAYVLNEGLWGANNASLSLITKDGITNDWFAQINGRGLGDLGQDLIHYGSKLYIIVHSSSTIECVDHTTGMCIKQINLENRKPRYAVTHEGKIYVSCYDKSVVRIDTTSLAIEATCRLSGLQPEQLCIVGENIYVCNTWQQVDGGQTIYDSTISIISLDNFEETGKITVGLNPNRIKALDDHRFIVACNGDYGSHPASTLVVDVSNGSQTELEIAATNFDICDGTIYLYSTSYDTNWNTTTSFYKVDAKTLAKNEILKDQRTVLSNAYSINVDPETKNIYICNSVYGVNSDVFAFSPDGTLLNQYEAGTFANKVVF